MSARLHHERVGDGAALVAFTHGIFGSGANWRSIARAVVARRPGWGAVLVDLRLHGRSEAGAPPHTVAACAADLAALFATLPVRVAVGHSFGGKVVLATGGLAARVVLDASPAARPDAWDAPGNSVRAAWESMAALDRTWARREDYVAALVARGHEPGLASWLAMNLAPADGGLRLRLDLAAVRALLADYYATDLWARIEDPAAGPLHVVVARRGATVSDDDLARLRRAPGHVTTTVVDGGHWLNVDAPAAVVDAVVAALPA